MLSAITSAYVQMDVSGLELPQFYFRLMIHKHLSTTLTGPRLLKITFPAPFVRVGPLTRIYQ